MHLPEVCSACSWKRICSGGYLLHRYSRLREFDNPSVFCESLKTFYAHVATYLVSRGLSVDELLSTLLETQTSA